MSQHTPARYHSHWIVPQGWSDDIGLSAALSLLLIVLAVLGTRYGPRVLGMTSEAPALVACSVCGEETVSASGRCAEDR